MSSMSEKKLNYLREKYKGKGGGPESESTLVDNKMDSKEGFVRVWSDNHNVEKILNKIGPDGLVDFTEQDNGVYLLIKKEYFRGIHCAFRGHPSKKYNKGENYDNN